MFRVALAACPPVIARRRMSHCWASQQWHPIRKYFLNRIQELSKKLKRKTGDTGSHLACDIINDENGTRPTSVDPRQVPGPLHFSVSVVHSDSRSHPAPQLRLDSVTTPNGTVLEQVLLVLRF